jgi:hypothetical protein
MEQQALGLLPIEIAQRAEESGFPLRFSEHLPGVDGEAMFRHACRMGSKASSRRS